MKYKLLECVFYIDVIIIILVLLEILLYTITEDII